MASEMPVKFLRKILSFPKGHTDQPKVPAVRSPQEALTSQAHSFSDFTKGLLSKARKTGASCSGWQLGRWTKIHREHRSHHSPEPQGYYQLCGTTDYLQDTFLWVFPSSENTSSKYGDCPLHLRPILQMWKTEPQRSKVSSLR